MADEAMLQRRYRDLTVSYQASLDGGGMTFGQLYVDYLRARMRPVGHAFEYCAGPGFIGFSLLAHGLCERLTLSDVNPVAVAACERTIRDNGLASRVRVYLSDGLDNIPESERWDLVVSNPPHWRGTHAQWKSALRLVDPDFIIHRKLYRGVVRHLTADGRVIIQENGLATRPADFDAMIRQGGLRVVEVHPPEGLRSPTLHHLRSRAVLRVERFLDTPAAESLFRKDRRRREAPRRRLKPYYFVWSERATPSPGPPSPRG